MNPTLASTVLLSAVLAAAGCAHASDRLSAEEHRAEALRLEARAAHDDEEAVHYRQEVSPPIVYQGLVAAPSMTLSAGPGTMLRSEAAAARAHALEHVRAAAALEQFELKSCEGATDDARASCPLLRPYVARLVETDRGVDLVFRPEAPVESIVRRMRCHLAFARSRGYANVPSCPLYAPGVGLEQSSDAKTVSLRAPNAPAAAQLRASAREELGAVLSTQQASAPQP